MRRILTVALLSAASIMVAAQPPSDSTAVDRAAMQKLSFLAGSWSGPATIVRGPGEPIHLTQSEKVEYKLGGLVLLIEGKSTGQDGSVPFEALATVAYDDASRSYRIRAYNAGHYVDTELTVQGDGFSWGFAAGPAQVLNTMHLTPSHEWQETSEVTLGSNPPRRTVDMLLTARH